MHNAYRAGACLVKGAETSVDGCGGTVGRRHLHAGGHREPDGGQEVGFAELRHGGGGGPGSARRRGSARGVGHEALEATRQLSGAKISQSPLGGFFGPVFGPGFGGGGLRPLVRALRVTVLGRWPESTPVAWPPGRLDRVRAPGGAPPPASGHRRSGQVRSRRLCAPLDGRRQVTHPQPRAEAGVPGDGGTAQGPPSSISQRSTPPRGVHWSPTAKYRI